MHDPDRTRIVGECPLQRERHLVFIVIRPGAFQPLYYGMRERISRALAHGRVPHREAQTGESRCGADRGGDRFGADLHNGEQ